MSQYKISVITPFHNVDPAMFEHAARSMENQTLGFENIEWVIVLHNCNEASLRSARERVGAYENVVLKELVNKVYNPSSPRNYGLEFATADYVAFLDGDDNYRPDAMEKVLSVFERTHVQMVVFRREFELQRQGMTALTETVPWNQTYQEIVVSKGSGQDNRLYNDFPFFITSRAYDRKFLDAHHIRFEEDFTIAEDCCFNLEVTHYADRICYCPQLIGYNYYINEGSILSSAKTDEEILTMVDSAVQILERTLNYGIYANTIIRTLCFVMCRYAADPHVSLETKLRLKDSLEGYLNMTTAIPEGRFAEPFQTLLNTLPQQVFSSIKRDGAADLSQGDGVDILAGILARNRNTDYGSRYLFGDIMTARGYQAQTPLSDYDTYAPLIDLQASIGEQNIVTASPVRWYVKNPSGRRLPVTEEQFHEFLRVFSHNVRGKQVFYWYEEDEVSEVYNDGVAANTIAKMSLAGYLDKYRYRGEEQPSEFTSPECIYFPKAGGKEDIQYVNVLLGLANRDVDQVLCSFASEVGTLFDFIRANAERLCRDIETGTVSPDVTLSETQRKMIRAYLTPDRARADELRAILCADSLDGCARRIWPKLNIVSCAGTGAQGKYMETVRKYFGDMPHSNGSLATFAGAFGEAVDGTDRYELALGTNFYEFLDKDAQPGTRPVFRSGLKTGNAYRLIVTTPSGLYRYQTGISIRIEENTEEKTVFTLV